MKTLATNVVDKFSCLQADCPDTCCKGWSMQVDDLTVAKYKSSNLQETIIEENGISVMRRDPQTDYCVKFNNGLCGIQVEKGEEYLGDACHLYPRITRQFGEQKIVTSTLSCPEIARISLFEENIKLIAKEPARAPSSIINYIGNLSVHQVFLDACTEDSPPEKIMAKIYFAALSLKYIKQEDWAGAAPLMLKLAEGRIQTPEAYDNDSRNILQIFAAIFYATRKKMNPRLAEVLQQMELALGAKINWENLEITVTDNQSLYKTLERKNLHNELLKKFLASQVSFSTFPFAGLSENIEEKAILLLFRFALTRLAIMCHESPDEAKIIQIVQSLARIIDHLGSPTLTFNLIKQFGFDKDARVMGLLNCAE